MITDYISEVLGVNPVPEVRGEEYQMWDDGGVECAVGEFLWAMTRLLRPNYVLETGVYHGWSSSYIGCALNENNKGYLDAVEYEIKHIQTSKEKWQKLKIDKRIVEHHISSLEFTPKHNYELIFLDTEPQIRFQELVRFYPYLNEGGYVFIHDTPRNLTLGNINPDHPEFKSWPFGDLPEEINIWVQIKQLIPFHLPSPRGLIGFYKRHKDDYEF